MKIIEKLTDKINVNFLISAVSITAFGWWYYSKQDILLVLSCCLAIYLFFVFVNHCYKLINEYMCARKRKEELNQKQFEEEKYIQQLIDIRFAQLRKYQIDNLLKLLTWDSVPSANNVKVHSPDKELVSFNSSDFSIPTGLHREPLVILAEANNSYNDLKLTYCIHPYLLKLLEDYKSKQ